MIDLRKLTFMDSTGLRSLLATDQLCRERGHQLRIIPGPKSIRRLFEVTGMETHLTLTDTV